MAPGERLTNRSRRAAPRRRPDGHSAGTAFGPARPSHLPTDWDSRWSCEASGAATNGRLAARVIPPRSSPQPPPRQHLQVVHELLPDEGRGSQVTPFDVTGPEARDGRAARTQTHRNHTSQRLPRHCQVENVGLRHAGPPRRHRQRTLPRRLGRAALVVRSAPPPRERRVEVEGGRRGALIGTCPRCRTAGARAAAPEAPGR